MTRYCLLTNDVEMTSIKFNRLSVETGERVLKEGMPVLLELYEKYDVQATFFFTGDIAEKFPEIVRMILHHGHEVGCHGYSHEVNESFDTLSLEQQKEHLRKAKNILEEISGQEVISFRAPALRVNHNTVRALAETEFKIDSSVSSQRFDMLLSFGEREKIKRIYAPRLPYRVDTNSLYKRGESSIIEIPISALINPYIGTTMRVSPLATRLTAILLNLENRVNGKPINFLVHPNEFIEENGPTATDRRSKSMIDYVLKDVIRQRLKLRNLGKAAIPLYEREIKYFKDRQYIFKTLRTYAEDNRWISQTEAPAWQN